MPYVTIVTIGFLPYTLATIRALEFHQVEGISLETPIPLMTTHAYPLDLFQCRHSHVFTRTSWVEKIIQLQQLQINTFPNISYKLHIEIMDFHGFSHQLPKLTIFSEINGGRPSKSWAMAQRPMRWTGYRGAVASAKSTPLGHGHGHGMVMGWSWEPQVMQG